jgi:hypothetical protein
VVEHFGWVHRRGRIWMVQRPARSGQLAGLWELPPAPAEAPLLLSFSHAITNRRITAHVRVLARPPGEGQWMTSGERAAAPLTGLTKKILRALRP